MWAPRSAHCVVALLALCAISPSSAGFNFKFVKSTDTDTDTDFSGFLPSWLDSDKVLAIPIGVDPSLIDPKMWVNFTAPDSDLYLITDGSDSDSDSDSEVSLHVSVVRIVFHYLKFAVGKEKATRLMNAMEVADPSFAVAPTVAEQSDDMCESAQGEGWTMAQMTTEQFMSADVQAQVAQVLISSVGEDVPVITGVKTESGDCLLVQATGDDTVWTSADCSTEAAALCAASAPNPDTEDIFIATVSAEVGEPGSSTAVSTIGMFSTANLLVVCLCATAMFGFVQARRMKRQRQGSVEEKMPLNSAPVVSNGATSHNPATLV